MLINKLEYEIKVLIRYIIKLNIVKRTLKDNEDRLIVITRKNLLIKQKRRLEIILESNI